MWRRTVNKEVQTRNTKINVKEFYSSTSEYLSYVHELLPECFKTSLDETIKYEMSPTYINLINVILLHVREICSVIIVIIICVKSERKAGGNCL